MSSINHVPDVEVPAKARPRTYSASYKARILEEYDALDKTGKGALLRREGLYTSLIAAWRKQRDAGVRQALAKPAGRPRRMPGIGRSPGFGARTGGCAAIWTPPGRLSTCRESSPRCWTSSPPAARPCPGARPGDRADGEGDR